MIELFDPPTARAIELYPWQAEAVEALRGNIRAEIRNQVLSAPTGSGKTLIASYLLHECHAKGKRGVFVADRVNLIDQTSRTFDEYGIPHGVIQADHWRWRPWERIQVASAQTLTRRGWPDADVIIVDEAHSLYKSVLQRTDRRDTVVIGLTATPFSRGMGRHYDAVVTVRTTNQLIQDGYLAHYDIWAASEPDMQGVTLNRKGEWNEEEAGQRAMPIIGDIVTEYVKHGAEKKFIAFGCSVAHCEEIQRQMMDAGIWAGLYTYRTGDAEREAMLKEFRDPHTQMRGLISVSALAKGFDDPTVEVVILARPLRKSLAEHIQMLGRGLRRDPDNPAKRCTVLDHSGNCYRFYGAMEAFFEEGASELDDGTRKEKKKAEKKEKEPMKCPRCAFLHDPRPMCPSCGHEYPKRLSIEHVPGTLSELTGHEAGSRDDRQQTYSELLGLAHQREWMEGAAAHLYKARYGGWPDGLARRPAPPSPKLVRWVRSQMIRRSKGRAKGSKATEVRV